MAYIRKTYAFKNGKMTVFNGHIKKETAVKRGFDSVTLSVHDMSGKGRGEDRRFYSPHFEGMRSFT